MFHASLIILYKETLAHGPNFEEPPPDIIDDTDEYEVKTILKSRPTTNRRGVQYLVKWKGYSNAENEWLTRTELSNASKLVDEFHRTHPDEYTHAQVIHPTVIALLQALLAPDQDP